MNTLIRNGQIVEDGWQWIDADEALPAARLATGGRFLLPLALWLAHRTSLDPARAGVWLGPDDEPESVLPWLADIPLIAIRFPVFTDGRGYSLARLLRNRHGYTGELRAVGDVLRDQLYFLHHCGFDAFQLRADQLPHEALAAFRDYSWEPVTAR
jgi:uncharacterized protein (DUF934 family)